ncbi:hypothetical protein RN001_012443 [Aquatica leii]|uniref:DUF4780 domain-containing protein n=1 Tax=Aquatica leii TaxID=1421715 RepID=A0AAN7P7A3_9COLE|nr:hypothetical protein RN001_012443 [Aquatica leii]
MDQEQTKTKTNLSAGAPGTDERKKLSGAARRKLRKAMREPGGSKQPVLSSPKEEGQPSISQNKAVSRTGTQKRHRSDDSTPKGGTLKKAKSGTKKDTRTFSEAATGFKMAFVYEDLECTLSEEETRQIKTWILDRIDTLSTGTVSPKFTECRHRGEALLITCADQVSVDWLRTELGRVAPWKGAKLRFLEAKDLPKPVRAHAWIPGAHVEPVKILKRIEIQNAGVVTSSWRVVDRKEDPKGQTLIVLMDQTSWDKMGAICNHNPYVNFSRVTFKLISKTKVGGEEATSMECEETTVVEGPSEEPQPTASSTAPQLVGTGLNG